MRKAYSNEELREIKRLTDQVNMISKRIGDIERELDKTKPEFNIIAGTVTSSSLHMRFTEDNFDTGMIIKMMTTHLLRLKDLLDHQSKQLKKLL